jgi:ribosomal protein S4
VFKDKNVSRLFPDLEKYLWYHIKEYFHIHKGIRKEGRKKFNKLLIQCDTLLSHPLLEYKERCLLSRIKNIYNFKFHEDKLELFDDRINFRSVQKQFFILSQLLYSHINDNIITVKYKFDTKIRFLALRCSTQEIIMSKILNFRVTGGKLIQPTKILYKKVISQLNIFYIHKYWQNVLLEHILNNPCSRAILNYHRTIVDVLEGFEKGPHYKYKSYKSFKIKMRKYSNRSKRNAVLSFVTQDWIGPMITKKSREIRVAKQTRNILYENLRYFYGLLKIGSIWQWVSSYRGRVNRTFKIETFLKYYELNLELLLYRSGFVPTRNLSKVYIKSKNICVNGKIIDAGKFRISNLDIITFGSSVRIGVKIMYTKYSQSVLYSKKSGLLTFASKFLETNYSIFGFTYLSQLFKLKYIPIMDFRFRNYDRNRLVYWGKYDIGKRHRSKVVW